MLVYPLNNQTAVLIEEGESVLFTPAFKPDKVKPEQVTREPFHFRPIIQIDCRDCCNRAQIIFGVLFLFAIVGLIMFLVACGHGICGSEGNVSRRPPPKF